MDKKKSIKIDIEVTPIERTRRLSCFCFKKFVDGDKKIFLLKCTFERNVLELQEAQLLTTQ